MKPLFLFAVLGLSLFAQAQRPESSLGIGPSVGIPPSFRGQWGTGASVRAYIGTTKSSAVLLNSNLVFYPTSYEGKHRTVSMLKAGYATHVLHPRLFVYGDAGLAVSYDYWGGRSNAAAGVGVGYSLPVGTRKYIDIVPGWNFLLRHGIGPWLRHNSSLELHFAYRFALK